LIDGEEAARPRQRMFNMPAAVTWTAGLLLAIHATRYLLLSPRDDLHLLLALAFVPARYSNPQLSATLPGGEGADIWTFVSYALLHGSWTHVLLNVMWLIAFGSVVARRFGPLRFLVFLAVAAAAGAAMHLIVHQGAAVPMIGASAAVSGCMAAAIRFMFAPDPYARVSLLQGLRDRRVIAFIAVWFGINLIFGLGALPLLGEEQAVAWEAHVGGFLVGLLLFAPFDPARRAEVV
jgi:membrane associated rhomboid family serine protease